MFDISVWSSNGAWSGWSIEDYPPPLSNQVCAFFQALKGANPVHLQVQDSRGWGVKGYYVKEGYRELLLQNSLLPKSSWWSNIWSTDGIPKINMFCWILAHGKTLTEDNLLKRGFQGPFCCVLCANNFETTQHLFLDCTFSRQVWLVVYQ
jgi:hypothetical protein